jgi:hypothetical protein
MEKSTFENSIYGNIQKLTQISSVEGDVYILDIAESLLERLIRETVERNHSQFNISIIEKDLMNNVIQKNENEIQEMRAVLEKIISEVKLLSSRTPGLNLMGDAIEISRTDKKSLFSRKEYSHKVDSQIELLKLAVENRRLEMGLPTQKDIIGIDW